MDAEKTLHIERHEGDEMIRGTLMDGQVRIMMCDTTQMVQRAADIHHATPVCTAAMGRLMTATSMLGVMMKGENESVTVNIKGGGPMGTVVAVANHGDIKVCADDPQVELPLREDGKLNVGAGVGAGTDSGVGCGRSSGSGSGAGAGSGAAAAASSSSFLRSDVSLLMTLIITKMLTAIIRKSRHV